jgi:ribose transport system permease protein
MLKHAQSGTEDDESLSADAQAASSRTPPASPRQPVSLVLGRYSAVFLWIGFLILFGILKPDLFLTVSTFRLTFGEGVVTAILALAFLVPLAAGTYDLSVGAMMGLSLCLLNWFSNNTGLPIVVVSLITIGICCASGFVSALLVVQFRVNSLIATLGVSQVLSAVTLKISDNRQVIGKFNGIFEEMGSANLLGVPVVVLLLAGLAVVVWFVLEHTPVGRHLFAVGGNPEAARLAGLGTSKLIYGSFIASAGIASLAGIVYAMRVGVYTSEAGPGLLFPALAAVFFGASQFSGRPNVWGTLVAYFALAFGIKGLQLAFGPGTFWIQPLFQGAALLIAVALASRQVTQTRKSRRAQAAAAATT